jgi:hypothetical protein
MHCRVTVGKPARLFRTFNLGDALAFVKHFHFLAGFSDGGNSSTCLGKVVVLTPGFRRRGPAAEVN